MNEYNEKIFREKIKTRIKFFAGLCTLSALILAFFLFYEFIYSGNKLIGHLSDFLRGFSMGIFSVFTVICVLYFINCIRASADEEKLKELFIRENDERLVFINNQIGTSSLYIVMCLTFISGVVSSFFNATVCITLYSVFTFTSLLHSFLRAYYTSKY